ncbi:hypothetical protein CK203_002058 [Vitis vinifera]|uniref:Reverse transcriptase zinc-binding domain-containing protein n=1 Tax=Vitis vinifera TaxID=29760 RepID=A0A438KJZ7_VITVI|nr:hypothetical protein CK203_002058 [Vitis vinifera]
MRSPLTIFFSIAKKQVKCGSCSLLFGVNWVFPSLVRETLLGWKGAFVGKKRRAIWNVGPLYLFWSVWKTRNKIAFDDGVLSLQKLKAFFL